jgi:hypothetical protein
VFSTTKLVSVLVNSASMSPLALAHPTTAKVWAPLDLACLSTTAFEQLQGSNRDFI